jgi:mannose-6-phosphate isomerase-like protein (cupin superfamily)
METTRTAPRVVGAGAGAEGFLGSIGVRFLIDGADTSQGFSVVEHPMSPRALAAPLHLHTREDEYSFVLEGRMGALLGDDVVEAGPGDLVFKPRNQWHTFWNAGDEPCRILEIIAPAGFEQFFRELADMGGAIGADPDELVALGARYGHFFKLESVPELLDRFGLQVGEPLTGGWQPRAAA